MDVACRGGVRRIGNSERGGDGVRRIGNRGDDDFRVQDIAKLKGCSYIIPPPLPQSLRRGGGGGTRN